jgi:uncharacterized protein YggT (Ycf19 family)
MWRRLKIFLSIFFILFLSWKAESQSLVYSFIDPCTKTVTNFNIPIQGGTTIFFLGQQRSFTANDISNGVFGTWVNQVYSDYRKISPCSVQSTTVVRNQITSQIIGNTVSSVVGLVILGILQMVGQINKALHQITEELKEPIQKILTVIQVMVVLSVGATVAILQLLRHKIRGILSKKEKK